MFMKTLLSVKKSKQYFSHNDSIPFKKIWINIKNIASNDYFFIKHEKLQLSNNYALDLSNIELLQNKAGYAQYMKETQTTFVKKSKYDCCEDNSMYITDCINDFYAKQLKCNLPWATKMDPDLKQCESKDELEQFRMLSAEITLPNLTEKIKDMECFKPNCLQTTWTKNSNSEQKYAMGRNDTELWITMNAITKVIRRQEILLADFSTFLADCGGYLGLFLGASLLSITDAIIAYTCRCLRSVHKFCIKPKKSNPIISSVP